ncbi:hypothetical protein ZIOFF_032693 [Zingiber officinale]|uniref:PSII 6.1 kDa protein n=2 Tax=Zingiber officinale TaxID=94328 RepID=A0A8J5LBR6_ZINOF|nr:hypothetical protein ZIOFF_032693 [Zingiber officinale]
MHSTTNCLASVAHFSSLSCASTIPLNPTNSPHTSLPHCRDHKLEEAHLAPPLMATVVNSAAPASTFAHRAVLPRQSATGLPQLACKGGRSVRCSMEAKSRAVATTSTGAAVLAMAASASPVLALVDERLSTEGTGLSLGISNNLLGWILFGVFGLIWALYFLYTSTLEEDEDSALSL